MAAIDIAVALSQRFLRSGNFVLAGPQGGIHAAMPAAAGAPQIAEFDEYGFAGLSVQSVGVERGVPNPKVHIYVTKGSRVAERELHADGEEVEVVVNRIGRVIIRPETAAASTHAGQVFIRGARVACGSSCAPSAESYAGTLGALVRKTGARANATRKPVATTR